MQRPMNPANMTQGLSVQNLQQNSPNLGNPTGMSPVLSSERSGGWLQGYGPQVNRYPLGSPNQMSASEQLLQQGLGNMNRNPSFEPYAANVRQQMQEYGLPSIYSRINALGASQGPAAGRLASKAMSDLEGQLAMGRSQFDQGQQQLGMQQVQMGMNPMYHNEFRNETAGFGLEQLLPLIGNILGGATTGGMGAGIGGAAGSAIAALLQKYLSGGSQSNNGFNAGDMTKGFGSNGWYPQQSNQGYMFGQQNNGGFTV